MHSDSHISFGDDVQEIPKHLMKSLEAIYSFWTIETFEVILNHHAKEELCSHDNQYSNP